MAKFPPSVKTKFGLFSAMATESHISHLLSTAALTIQGSYAALPTQDEIRALSQDALEASARGYYDPVEDEKLREIYTRYLGIRSAIWAEIQNLKPIYRAYKKGGGLTLAELQAFGIAFSGAEIIVRTGEFLIALAHQKDIIWRKLDEAEPRFGLRRKSFTRVNRQLTSAFKMYPFYRAVEFFDTHRDIVMSALIDGGFDKNVKILERMNQPKVSRGDHLKRYGRFVRFSLKRRRKSAQRNMVFALFQGTGEDIADLKIPFIKPVKAPKRVDQNVIEELMPDLRPGDVFITRHDDAMSNLFLPGFWPHAAFFIGEQNQRPDIPVHSDGLRMSSDEGVSIVESKKDGVLFRRIEETLHLDAFVVMRPKLSEKDIFKAVERGMSHAGKLYDFIFDFGTADRLVCTELIYRAYQGIGGINFKLSTKAGRKCLSAEDFLSQSLANDWFEPVIIYGVNGNVREDGEPAHKALLGSFDAN